MPTTLHDATAGSRSANTDSQAPPSPSPTSMTPTVTSSATASAVANTTAARDGHQGFDPDATRYADARRRRRGQVQHQQRHRRPDLRRPRRSTTRARPMSVPTTSTTSPSRSPMARSPPIKAVAVTAHQHVNGSTHATSVAQRIRCRREHHRRHDGHRFGPDAATTFTYAPPAAPTRPSSASIAPPAPWTLPRRLDYESPTDVGADNVL